MAKFIPENIQTLLNTFKFDIYTDCINEDLTCTICKKMLHDVYQSTCDCKYCLKCIVSYINDGNEYCPGSKESCRENLLVLDESVLSNAFLNKKVLKVRVHCPNESCQFASTLSEMEDHLRLGSHQIIECPFTKIGCSNERVNRDSVETHLNKDMLAHSQMLMEVVDNLKNEVQGLNEQMTSLREECKLKETEKQEERKMNQEERSCLVAVVEELKGEMAALRRQAECAEENQQRLKKLEEEGMELRGEIEMERQELRKMIDENEALKKEVDNEREESRKMSGEIVALKKEMGTKIVEVHYDGVNEDDDVNIKNEIESLKKEMDNKREESRKMSGEIESLKKEMENQREESRKMSVIDDDDINIKSEALKNEVDIETEKSRKTTGKIESLKNEVGTKREESRKVKFFQRDTKRIDSNTGRKKKTEVKDYGFERKTEKDELMKDLQSAITRERTETSGAPMPQTSRSSNQQAQAPIDQSHQPPAGQTYPFNPYTMPQPFVYGAPQLGYPYNGYQYQPTPYNNPQFGPAPQYPQGVRHPNATNYPYGPR